MVCSFAFSLRAHFGRELNYRSAKKPYQDFLYTHCKGNIAFRLPRWEIFSSHARVGTGVLLFLAKVLFLVGRLHNMFCLNAFFSCTATRGPTRTQCSFILVIKDHFICGESHLYQNLAKFQNIISSIVGILIFFLCSEI